MIRAFQAGDHEQARRINAELGPSFAYPVNDLWQAPAP